MNGPPLVEASELGVFEVTVTVAVTTVEARTVRVRAEGPSSAEAVGVAHVRNSMPTGSLILDSIVEKLAS